MLPPQVLAAKEGFFVQLVDAVVANFGGFYPELITKRDHINNVIRYAHALVHCPGICFILCCWVLKHHSCLPDLCFSAFLNESGRRFLASPRQKHPSYSVAYLTFLSVVACHVGKST